VPEQGYWNRINAGQSPRKAVFVDVDDPRVNHVVISGRLTSLDEETRSALDAVRKANRTIQMRPVPDIKKPPLTTPLKVPHPAIAATVRALRIGHVNEKGAIHVAGEHFVEIDIGPKCVERTISFLDALVRSLEATALPALSEKDGMKIGSPPDTAVFSITEVTRRVKHKPTEEELAREKARARKRQQDYERHYRNTAFPLPSWERVYPEFDWERSGVLYLEIRGWEQGVRHKWSDGKHQTLETLIDSIVGGLHEVIAVRKVRREERESYERRRAEALRRLELAKKRRARETLRIEYLERLAQQSAEASRLRDWISSLAVKAEDLDLARMVEWLRQRLAKIEVSIAPTTIGDRLREKALFPETDDLSDPLGEPSEDILPHW
jgi:hypothetical protein